MSAAVLAVRAHTPAEEMQESAAAFLAALDDARRSKAVFAFDDRERENWNFVPVARAGLPLQDMSASQRELAFDLLRSGLSHGGLERTRGIIALENVLRELEGGAAYRDATRYFVSIFGEPASDRSWGWRFEGHHVAFNFTLVDGSEIFFAPSFLGSNPAEVRSGPLQGTRVLGEEDDAGRAFVKSLDAAQRKIAIFSDRAPREIITGNDRRATWLTPVGIPASQLTPAQREALLGLIRLYLNRWRPELAEEKWREIAAAPLEEITFGWAGGLERGEGNYHRIQCPSLLIEFDNTQNNANHIHTSVRDFKGDFGHDRLREHYDRDHAR